MISHHHTINLQQRVLSLVQPGNTPGSAGGSQPARVQTHRGGGGGSDSGLWWKGGGSECGFPPRQWDKGVFVRRTWCCTFTWLALHIRHVGFERGKNPSSECCHSNTVRKYTEHISAPQRMIPEDLLTFLVVTSSQQRSHPAIKTILRKVFSPQTSKSLFVKVLTTAQQQLEWDQHKAETFYWRTTRWSLKVKLQRAFSQGFSTFCLESLDIFLK